MISSLREACDVSLGAAGQPRWPCHPRRPSRTTPGTTTHRTRNTNRGIRSAQATEKRRTQRSQKRNAARNLHRRQNHVPTAPAQELQPRTPKIDYGVPYILASLNVRGMKKRGKKQEIEQYMKDNQIDVLVIQETHIGDEIIEHFKKSNHIWYYSGGGLEPKGEACYHGVGIVIKKELANYVLDVETISERLMTITLRGKIPVTIASAYAPTAVATAEDKDNFYNALTKLTKKFKKKRHFIHWFRHERKTNRSRRRR